MYEENLVTYSRADFDALTGVSMAKIDTFIEGVFKAKAIRIPNPFKRRGRPRKNVIYVACPFCGTYRAAFNHEPEIDLMGVMCHDDDCVWEMAYEIINKCPSY